MQQKDVFNDAVCAALKEIAGQKGLAGPLDVSAVRVEIPPDPKMGDLGCPMFPFARVFKENPALIAQKVCQQLQQNVGEQGAIESFQAAGSYVNARLNRGAFAFDVLCAIQRQGLSYGMPKGSPYEGKRVMIEFSSPNTNKPLHLGHLRNDALGESVSRILKKAGADVFKVDLINDRGIHICKSMSAYKLLHEGRGDTPATLGMKGDHFAGQCYVEFDKLSKEDPDVQKQAEDMLVAWEAGEEATRKLWQLMNGWTIEGIQATYQRTGITFDKIYFESDTYLKGRDVILKGLEEGVFFRSEDGSVRVDVSEVAGEGKDGEGQQKVLLRKDGTSVYITQDIGTAISRHDDWPFDQMVYVVASEQNYHFRVLFYILKKLGFEWASRLLHLSYGLVNLPDGRMKSREGTVVDADDLLDELHAKALAAIQERDREEEVASPDAVAEKVALAAVHYYLLASSPEKDMLFKADESVSFTGDTGPYLQYMGSRLSSILRKATERGLCPSYGYEDASLLSGDQEWALIKDLSHFPDALSRAASSMDPSVMASYCHTLCKDFSQFYRDCPVLAVAEQNERLSRARLAVVECTLCVLKEAMDLVLVPFLDRM